MKKYLLIGLTLLIVTAWLVSPLKAYAQDGTTPLQPPTGGAPVTVQDLAPEAPANVNLVLLDRMGNVVPLNSAQAKKIIATGDPMFCPVSAVFGSPACTSFTTIEDALAFASADNPYGGTIYVQDTYVSPTATLVIDGGEFANNYILAVLGGYCFDETNVACAYGSLNGTTTLQQPVEITGWGDAGHSAVTLANFVIYPIAMSINQPTLEIHDTSNVTVKNTTVNDWEWVDGISISNAGNVKLDNVEVNESDWGNGIGIYYADDITISNSLVNEQSWANSYADNDDNGIYAEEVSNLTILNTEVYVDSGGEGYDLTNNGIAAKWVDGLTLANVITQVTGDAVDEYSSGNGIFIQWSGNIFLNKVTSSGNLRAGANIYETGEGDPLKIWNSQFSGNGNGGLWINEHEGDVEIRNTEVNYNLSDSYYGTAAMIAYVYGGDVTIFNSTFNFNGWLLPEGEGGGGDPVYLGAETYTHGLGVLFVNGGNVIWDMVDASGNSGYGAWAEDLYSEGFTPIMSINNSTFNGNGYGYEEYAYGGGLFFGFSSADLSIANSMASGNAADGATVGYNHGNVNIINSVFQGNGYGMSEGDFFGSGLMLEYLTGDISLRGIDASYNAGNGLTAIYLGSEVINPSAIAYFPPPPEQITANLTITLSQFLWNGGPWLDPHNDVEPDGSGISIAYQNGNTTLYGVTSEYNYGNGFRSLYTYGDLLVGLSNFNYNGPLGTQLGAPVIGSSSFEGPSGVGIFDGYRYGDTTLEGVAAIRNAFGGAEIGSNGMYNEGNVFVLGSWFNENGGEVDTGIGISTTGYVVIYHSAANGNLGDGVFVSAGEGVYVDGLTSLNNWGDGIHINAFGVISAPGIGEVITQTVDAMVVNSTIVGNEYAGIDYFGYGTLTLCNDVIAGNNYYEYPYEADVYVVDPGIVVYLPAEFCQPSAGEGGEFQLGPIIIPVEFVASGLGQLTGGTFETGRGMVFILRTLNPDGTQKDYAQVGMNAGALPAGSQASMTQKDAANLPAALPDGATYVGPAFTMAATDPDGNALTNTNGSMEIKIKLAEGYVVPEGQKLSIQVYANGVWTALATTVGGQYAYAYTDILGTFVLTTIPQ